MLENGRPQKVQLFGRRWSRVQEDSSPLNLGLLMTRARACSRSSLSQEAAVRFLESIPRARDL